VFKFGDIWSLDRTIDGKLQQTVSGEILKFLPLQTPNVLSMWVLSIAWESIVNKHEVATWDRHEWQEKFISLFLIYYTG